MCWWKNKQILIKKNKNNFSPTRCISLLARVLISLITLPFFFLEHAHLLHECWVNLNHYETSFIIIIRIRIDQGGDNFRNFQKTFSLKQQQISAMHGKAQWKSWYGVEIFMLQSDRWEINLLRRDFEIKKLSIWATFFSTSWIFQGLVQGLTKFCVILNFIFEK